MGDQTAKPPVTGYPAGQPGGGYYPTRPQAPGAAYNGGYAQPYPAYPQPYPAYQAPPPYRARRRRFLSIIVTLAVIAGIGILITWLALRPQRPKFHVENVTVSQLNVANSELNATMQFNISVRNPNKKIGIYYDSIVARAIYRREKIVSSQLPVFYQGHKNTTVLSYPLSADSLPLNTGVSRNLLADKALGSVDMTVNVDAWVHFKVGSWTTRHHLMSVFCDVTVHWNGSATGRLSQSKGCDLYMFSSEHRAMAPKKASKKTEEQPEGDIISDTTASGVHSVKSWNGIAEILEEELKYAATDSDNHLRDIVETELHKVAARPRLGSYTDMIA